MHEGKRATSGKVSEQGIGKKRKILQREYFVKKTKRMPTKVTGKIYERGKWKIGNRQAI